MTFFDFICISCRIFRPGQLFAKRLQAKPGMDALRQDAAQPHIRLQQHDITAAGIVCRNCRRHTADAAANHRQRM